MARKLPDPNERSPNEPAVLCSSNRVLSLYNNYNEPEAKRVSATVRKWFLDTAKEEGWTSAIFIKDIETKHSAGCILYYIQQTNVMVNVFIEGEDDPV